jgi:hypothetical protein
MSWQDITKAPPDRGLELAVIDNDEAHTLAFACRRSGNRWINQRTKRQIDVSPTHWREWDTRPGTA